MQCDEGHRPAASRRLRAGRSRGPSPSLDGIVSESSALSACALGRHAAILRRLCALTVLLLVTLASTGCKRAAPPVLEQIDVMKFPYAIQSMAWHPNGQWLAVGYFMRDEVEVWDVAQRKSLLRIPSQRRPANQSGQELFFTSDGRFLVTQDYLDTRNGEPKHPANPDDPAELLAQKDKERFLLARVWDLETRREVSQIKGPGSTMMGSNSFGICQPGGFPDRIAVHRKAFVAIYSLPNGKLLDEISVVYPFPDHPGQRRGYWKMACNPSRPEVALEGAQFFQEAPAFGFPANSGATPIVVVDLERKAVKKVLYSATPLNGVVYTADGGKLVSFGAPPIRVWDASADFARVGEIDEPHLNSGLMTPLAGYDGLLGVSNALRIWDTNQLRNPYLLDTKLYDTFRIAAHRESSRYAVAVDRDAYIYQLHLNQLLALKQGKSQK